MSDPFIVLISISKKFELQITRLFVNVGRTPKSNTLSFFYKGRCFYIGDKKQRLTFEEAVTLCKSQGARLFEPRNMEANEAIVNAVANNSRPPFWLGLVSTPERPSAFRYMSDGLMPYYTNWDSAQPDNDKGIEYCSQITYKDRYVFTLRCRINVESK